MSDPNLKDDLNYIKSSINRLGETEQPTPGGFTLAWALYILPTFILLEFAPLYISLSFAGIGFVVVMAVTIFVYSRAAPSFGVIDVRKGLGGLLQLPILLVYTLFLFMAVWFAEFPRQLFAPFIIMQFAIWESTKASQSLDTRKFVMAGAFFGAAMYALFFQYGQLIAFGTALTMQLFIDYFWARKNDEQA